MIQVSIQILGLKDTPRFHRTGEDPMGWIDYWMVGSAYGNDKRKGTTTVR